MGNSRVVYRVDGDTVTIFQENHTLRWDQKLPAAQRFVILAAFNNEAVLDKNTGLVREKSPDAISAPWTGAKFLCITKIVGGQRGWRIASIPELASLIDPSVAPPGPTLPPGHPFLNVQSSFYWSASAHTESPSFAWGVNFHGGTVGVGEKTSIDSHHAWCARGGMNADAY